MLLLFTLCNLFSFVLAFIFWYALDFKQYYITLNASMLEIIFTYIHLNEEKSKVKSKLISEYNLSLNVMSTGKTKFSGYLEIYDKVLYTFVIYRSRRFYKKIMEGNKWRTKFLVPWKLILEATNYIVHLTLSLAFHFNMNLIKLLLVILNVVILYILCNILYSKFIKYNWIYYIFICKLAFSVYYI